MNDLISNLSPEEKLLLSLCRLEFSKEQRAESGELMREVKDWEHFVALSNKHGVIALCWYNINKTGNNNNIPGKSLEILHSAYLKSLTRNTFLYNQLEEIAFLAEKENIKIVLLKGIALEKSVYGNKGLRQMNDIDILVSRDKAAFLRRILLKNGYESAPMVSRFHEKFLPAFGKHLPEMYKNGIAVEIHFKLFEQKGNSLTDEFIDKAARLPGKVINVYYPDPQLFFLYLIKHLDAHEKFEGAQLRLYFDLFILLSANSDSIINDDLFKYARKANLESIVIAKLNILNIYWKSPISIPGILFSENTNLELILQKFIAFLKHPWENQVEEKQENLFKLLKDVPLFRERFLLLTGHIFPSVAYLKYRYKIHSTAGALLYYPVRWIKQVGRLIGVKA
jgi:hypothetical protein